MKSILIALIYFFSLTVGLSAQDKTEKPALPQKGRLAGSTTGAFGDTGYEGSWGGENYSGDEAPPVSGSVSRTASSEWLAKIYNNTEDTYRVSLKIEQFNERNQKVKSDSMSLSLKGGESSEKVVRAHVTSVNAEINLIKWSKTEKKLNRDEIMAKITEKKKEIAELEKMLGGDEGGI